MIGKRQLGQGVGWGVGADVISGKVPRMAALA